MVISFRLGVQKVIVVNPSSRIHIPDGLIRSLCRHIDPFDLDFSPEKLNRWCMRSHFDFFLGSSPRLNLFVHFLSFFRFCLDAPLNHHPRENHSIELTKKISRKIEYQG